MATDGTITTNAPLVSKVNPEAVVARLGDVYWFATMIASRQRIGSRVVRLGSRLYDIGSWCLRISEDAVEVNKLRLMWNQVRL